MGKVLTVMNMKGGVGKTTVSMHIGGAASQIEKKNVLLIDYDPQFNLSQAFLPAKTYFDLEKKRKTTISILLDNDTVLNPYHIQVSGNHEPPKIESLATSIYQKSKYRGTLDLIPSTLDLMYVALGQSQAKSKIMEERFEKFILSCRKNYDLTIIDCHPAGSLFTKTSLRNSDDVLIPVISESSFATRGIGLMLNFINSKNIKEKSTKPHILFNMTPRYGKKQSEINIRSNKDFADLCLSSTLKRYKIFSEPEGGLGFTWNSKKAYSTEAFSNIIGVTREILKRMEA